MARLVSIRRIRSPLFLFLPDILARVDGVGADLSPVCVCGARCADVDREERVRGVWALHCPQEMLLSSRRLQYRFRNA